MRRSKVREHIFKMLFSIGFDAADADEQIELYLEQVEEASEEERGDMRKKVKDIKNILRENMRQYLRRQKRLMN